MEQLIFFTSFNFYMKKNMSLGVVQVKKVNKLQKDHKPLLK